MTEPMEPNRPLIREEVIALEPGTQVFVDFDFILKAYRPFQPHICVRKDTRKGPVLEDEHGYWTLDGSPTFCFYGSFLRGWLRPATPEEIAAAPWPKK